MDNNGQVYFFTVGKGTLTGIRRFPGPLKGGPGGTFDSGPGIFEGPEILRMLRVNNFVKSLKVQLLTG